MLYAELILFALAALGGIALASLALRGKTLPMSLAVLHGLLAVSGFALLLVSLTQSSSGGTAAPAGTAGTPIWPIISVILFAIAALGGLVLFTGFHLRGKKLPSFLVVVHALFAVAGFVLFLVWFAGAIR